MTYSLGLPQEPQLSGCPATWEAPGDKGREGSFSGPFGSSTLQEVFGGVVNRPVGPAPQTSVP